MAAPLSSLRGARAAMPPKSIIRLPSTAAAWKARALLLPPPPTAIAACHA